MLNGDRIKSQCICTAERLLKIESVLIRNGGEKI